MRRATMGLALLLAASPAALAGDCPEGIAPAARIDGVGPLLAAAERIAAEADAQKLNLRMAPVRSEVGCLGELVSPQLAARYHRLRAIQEDPLGLAPDKPEVVAPLITARALDPEFEFTDDDLPADHAVRGVWATLGPDDLQRRGVRPPREGSLAFDGLVSTQRPSNGATLYQRLDSTGAVVETAWLGAAEPLPAYDARGSARTGLLATSAGLAAGAIGLWAGAAVTEARLKDRDTARTQGEIDGMQRTANALLFSAIGVGVAAGGTATVAFVAVTP